MFTGLIVDIGKIAAVERKGSNMRIGIRSEIIATDARVGDSIAVDGVCLTVTKLQSSGIIVDAVEETLRKSNLRAVSVGDAVNLEPALKISDRLGGHFVQGHVDTTERIVAIQKKDGSWLVEISFKAEHSKYLIPVGSISVNGVSLTIAEKRGQSFLVSVIPHTFANTGFNQYAPGEEVNLEFDMIGKYVIGLVEEGAPDSGERLNISALRALGY